MFEAYTCYWPCNFYKDLSLYVEEIMHENKLFWALRK